MLAPATENGTFSDFPKGNNCLSPVAMVFCVAKYPAGASTRPTIGAVVNRTTNTNLQQKQPQTAAAPFGRQINDRLAAQSAELTINN